jgi:hypothetical protein
LAGDEFDVDLVQKFVGASADVPPATVKALVGDRLRANAVYARMLEEMPRCWRLNYANEFHLDITPAVPHSLDGARAIYVPDRRLRRWVPSNPVGFRELFERRATLSVPLTGLRIATRADVTAFPLHFGPKGVLRRLIQLLKHHRDLAFQNAAIVDLKPISIIITTLAARAYERLALSGATYETDYDLLLAVVVDMPRFIRVNGAGEARHYVVENETVAGENFAEKWNADPNLASAFYGWHGNAVAALRAIAELQGQDEVAKLTSREFGVGIGQRVLQQMKTENSSDRAAGQLRVHGVLGVVAQNIGSSTAVRSNTFFGR